MKPFERLGQAHTPDCTLLEFFRHDGAYLIRADGRSGYGDCVRVSA